MKTLFAKVLALAVLASMLGACKEEALTATARTGDTVIVSLSTDDLDEGMGLSSTAIVRSAYLSSHITDQSGEQYATRVRHVFKVYADPTSKVNSAASSALWMAAIDLVDPISSELPALSSGVATLTLSAPGYFESDKVVNLEIVPGLGAPKDLSELSFAPDVIEPAPQALARVTGQLAEHRLGAVEHLFVIPHSKGVDPTTGEEIAAALVRKLPGTANVSFNVQQATTEFGTSEVRVFLTAIQGLTQEQLSELDIALISELSEVNARPDYWIQHHRSSKYYDISGNQLSLTTEISMIR